MKSENLRRNEESSEKTKKKTKKVIFKLRSFAHEIKSLKDLIFVSVVLLEIDYYKNKIKERFTPKTHIEPMILSMIEMTNSRRPSVSGNHES